MRQLWQLLPSPSQGTRQAGSKNTPVLGGCLASEVSSGLALKDKRHLKKDPVLLLPAQHLPLLIALLTLKSLLTLLFTWGERDSPSSCLTLIPAASEETQQLHGC